MTNIKKFTCNLCNHVFQRQIHLDNHLEKKSCKIVKYLCKYCRKGFTTDNSMYRHMKHTCDMKKTEDNKKDLILTRLIRLEEDNIRMKKENNKLKKELTKFKQEKKFINNGTINNGTVTNKTVNNKTINNGTINNIVLIGYGKEDLAKIDRQDILKSLKKGFYSTLELTEAVHFNPKYPEYHNGIIRNPPYLFFNYHKVHM